MHPSTPRPVQLYVTAVAGSGLALLGFLLLNGSIDPPAGTLTAFWLFAALVLIGELWPIRVLRRDGGGEVTTGTAFAFALLLMAGTTAAILPQAVGSAVADLYHRKPLSRVFFNIGQYTLALASGGWVLDVMKGSASFTGQTVFALEDVVPLIAAGVVVFFVNITLTWTAIALDQGASVFSFLRQDFAFNVSTGGVLLAISPVLVVVATHSLPLIPLVLVTVGALYMSSRQSLEREHDSLHDLLTKLPNRRLFRERAEHTLAEANRTGGSVGVLVIDLDRFKEINDTLGHHVGDLVLQQVGPRLRSLVREIDTIARLGGDEFAVLLPHVNDETTAQQIARRMTSALSQPFVVQGFPLEVDASIGLALYPQHGLNVETLLQRADVAMYVAKQTQNGHEVYRDDRDHTRRGRIGLLAGLRTAIEQHQLVLHYQPKADMRSGNVRGVEALLRWQHPELGLIYPDDFIPLAEHTDLIGSLTRYVIEEALQQCRRWHDQGFMVSVAVNLSVYNLYDLQFPRDVAKLLREARMNASWLELELTENSVMADPLRAMGVMAELSAMGVRIAIDDFGTGYSSLAHLKQLPVNEIKIDKSFVMNASRENGDGVIVRSIIELARNLGLQVVAEGVETEEVWQLLEELGCHAAQGYFLLRPQSAEDVTGWLRQTGVQPAALPDTIRRVV